MSIRFKLLAGCLSLTLMTVGIGLYLQRSQHEIGTLATRIYDEALMSISYLRSAQNGLMELAVAGARADRGNDGTLAAESRRALHEQTQVAIPIILGDLEVARERTMSPMAMSTLNSLHARIKELGSIESALAMPELEDELAGLQEEFDVAVEVFAGDGYVFRRDVSTLIGSSMRHAWIAISFSALAAVMISFLLSRLIVPAVHEAVRIATSISEGHLDNKISSSGSGETGALLRALSLMQTRIAGDLSRIRALMDQQASSHTHEIIEKNAELSRAHAVLSDKVEQLQRLSLVARTANDSIFIADADGRIEYVNESFTRLTGLRLDNLKDYTAAFLLSGLEDDREKRKRISRAINAKESVRTEFLVPDSQGKPLWLDTAIVPLVDSSGRLTGHVNVSRDITEAKSREAELAKAKIAAEEGMRAKSLFLATVSHELRTPLHAVIGTLDLLRDTALDDTQRTYIDTIAESSDGLLLLVNMLLDLTRLEEGKVDLDIGAFDLVRATRSVVELLRPLAEDKEITIALHVDPPPPQHVSGDVGRFRQVVTNIVGNAVKFTEEGSVSVRLSWINGGCRILVEDTGLGIAADRLAAVFEPFTQEDAEITRRFGGTGLGLSISRMLARRMDGDITVRSIQGEGSTFTFEVPLPLLGEHQPAQPAKETETEQALDLAGFTILVVDDNRTNRFLVERFLHRSNARIHQAVDGIEALSGFDEHRPDAILMDISMPRMNGIDATREIRARETAGMHCAIIGLSANAFEEDQSKCFEAGMDGFLAKPVGRVALLRALSDVLAATSHRNTDEAVQARPHRDGADLAICSNS